MSSQRLPVPPMAGEVKPGGCLDARKSRSCSREVRIRVPFLMLSILVGEPSAKNGQKGTTEKPGSGCLFGSGGKCRALAVLGGGSRDTGATPLVSNLSPCAGPQRQAVDGPQKV